MICANICDTHLLTVLSNIYVGFHTSPTILTVFEIGNQLKFRLPVLNEGLFGLSFI